MIAFAAIGMLVASVIAVVLILNGFGLIRVMLGFTGTLNNPDGVMGIVLVVVGCTMLAAVIHFSPFHVAITH